MAGSLVGLRRMLYLLYSVGNGMHGLAARLGMGDMCVMSVLVGMKMVPHYLVKFTMLLARSFGRALGFSLLARSN